jgi:RNA 3'-terminal phosphate cyclase (ATP)
VDGSFGEGGGQILRTSLSLSAITGRPFTIGNIRLNRKPPGLRPQHLLSVTSAGEVCGARVSGADVGAREISFEPGALRSGAYRFDVGTAGATALVLQTLFFPLALGGGESEVGITGGTHVPMSPCYHYLAMQWLPALRRIGFDAEVEMSKAGFFPQGGGRIRARISPRDSLRPLRLTERGRLKQITGISAIANLPLHIAERQRDRAVSRLRAKDLDPAIQIIQMPSPGKGTMLLLFAEFEHATSCHFSLGAIGKRAERVADEACDEFLEFLSIEAAVERHLADQLLVPLALLQGESMYTTDKITPHLLTNAEIVKMFLAVEIVIEGEPGRPGKVAVRSRGLAGRAE